MPVRGCGQPDRSPGACCRCRRAGASNRPDSGDSAGVRTTHPGRARSARNPRPFRGAVESVIDSDLHAIAAFLHGRPREGPVEAEVPHHREPLMAAFVLGPVAFRLLCWTGDAELIDRSHTAVDGGGGLHDPRADELRRRYARLQRHRADVAAAWALNSNVEHRMRQQAIGNFGSLTASSFLDGVRLRLLKGYSNVATTSVKSSHPASPATCTARVFALRSDVQWLRAANNSSGTAKGVAAITHSVKTADGCVSAP